MSYIPAAALAGITLGNAVARRVLKRYGERTPWDNYIAYKARPLHNPNRTFTKRYAKGLALGLKATNMPVAIKVPYYTVPRHTSGGGVADHWSKIMRFCPIGKGNALSAGDWMSTFQTQDPRFAAMCGIYDQFRIRSVTWEIEIGEPADAAHTAYELPEGSTLQSVALPDAVESKMSIFAKVIRNCGKATPRTDFTSTNALNAPGVLWVRSRSGDRYPRLVVTVRPTRGAERQQWYSTNFTAGGDQSEFDAGAVMKFCPALDVILHSQKAIPSGSYEYPISIRIRAIVQFRSSRVPYSATREEEIKEVEAAAREFPAETEELGGTPLGERDGAGRLAITSSGLFQA